MILVLPERLLPCSIAPRSTGLSCFFTGASVGMSMAGEGHPRSINGYCRALLLLREIGTWTGSRSLDGFRLMGLKNRRCVLDRGRGVER